MRELNVKFNRPNIRFLKLLTRSTDEKLIQSFACIMTQLTSLEPDSFSSASYKRVNEKKTWNYYETGMLNARTKFRIISLEKSMKTPTTTCGKQFEKLPYFTVLKLLPRRINT